MRKRQLILAVCGLTTLAAFQATRSTATTAEPASSASTEQAAVETDVHEFMEYYNRPAFRRLKKAMTNAPDSDEGWSDIKSNALTLAEVGNLLFLRGPEENREDWRKNAVTVREAGRELYKAAQLKSFDHAEKFYVRLVNNCNQCHIQFAGGEHQLSP